MENKIKNLIIRPEMPCQYHAMEELVRDAFWDKYSPGCCEHLAVHKIRSSASAVPGLCLAAELDGELAGGIWYVRAAVRHADGSETPVYTMGPVAVRPGLQGQGIGSELIRHTLKLCAGRVCAVIIYGSPACYSRFGFRPGADFGITDSEGGECPAIQVYPLSSHVPRGAFDEGEVYHAAPGEIRKFDLNFPHRQKHLRSGQLFRTMPDPPPEDPLLKRSWELGNRAVLFLRDSGILEAWESIGGKIRSVGSFRTGLMMKDRDIDLHIYTESLDPGAALKAMAPLISSERTRKLTFINGADTDEHCLEWHLETADAGGGLWTVDMIQILAGSALDGFFEDTAEAVVNAMTPEWKKRILALKAAEPDGMNICGMEFCKAVMAGQVTSWEDFLEWRKSNPPGSLLRWRPPAAAPLPEKSI